MQNVKVSVVGRQLTLEIDLSQDLGPSQSGKTNLIATTNGNARIDGFDGYGFGLNVWKKKK
jgi:hypothetical protein